MKMSKKNILTKLFLLSLSLLVLSFAVASNKEEAARITASLTEGRVQVAYADTVIEKWCNTQGSGAVANCATYGGLYTWDVMMNGDGAGGQGICPEGWHIPTDEEWKQLEMHLGMSQAQADTTSWRGTNEGSKLAGNASLWGETRTIVTTDGFATSGFMALPGGHRYTDGSFSLLTTNGHWWSSSPSGDNALRRNLNRDVSTVDRHTYSKLYGFSARCLRD